MAVSPLRLPRRALRSMTSVRLMTTLMANLPLAMRRRRSARARGRPGGTDVASPRADRDRDRDPVRQDVVHGRARPGLLHDLLELLRRRVALDPDVHPE